MKKTIILLTLILFCIQNVQAVIYEYRWDNTVDFSYTHGNGRIYPNISITYDDISTYETWEGSIDIRYGDGNLTVFNTSMRNVPSLAFGISNGTNTVFTEAGLSGYFGTNAYTNFINLGVNYLSILNHSMGSYTINIGFSGVKPSASTIERITKLNSGEWFILFGIPLTDSPYRFFTYNANWMDKQHSVYLNHVDSGSGFSPGWVSIFDTGGYSELTNMSLPDFSYNGTDINDTVIENIYNITVNFNPTWDTPYATAKDYYVRIRECDSYLNLIYPQYLEPCTDLIDYNTSYFTETYTLDFNNLQITNPDNTIVEVFADDIFVTGDLIDYQILQSPLNTHSTVNLENILDKPPLLACVSFFVKNNITEKVNNVNYQFIENGKTIYTNIYNTSQIDANGFNCTTVKGDTGGVIIKWVVSGYEDNSVLVNFNSDSHHAIGLTADYYSTPQYFTNVTGYVLGEGEIIKGIGVRIRCGNDIIDTVSTDDTGLYLSSKVPLDTSCSASSFDYIYDLNSTDFYSGISTTVNISLSKTVYSESDLIKITLFVKNGDKYTLVEGQQIKLISLSGEGDKNKITDSNGIVVFNVNPASKWEVSVLKDGYKNILETVTQKEFTLTLYPTDDKDGYLSGVCKTSAGVIIPFANVKVYENNVLLPQYSTLADSNGVWEITGLNTDATVKVVCIDSDDNSGGTTVKIPGSGEEGLPPIEIVIGVGGNSNLIDGLYQVVEDGATYLELLLFVFMLLMGFKLMQGFTK